MCIFKNSVKSGTKNSICWMISIKVHCNQFIQTASGLSFMILCSLVFASNILSWTHRQFLKIVKFHLKNHLDHLKTFKFNRTWKLKIFMKTFLFSFQVEEGKYNCYTNDFYIVFFMRNVIIIGHYILEKSRN